MALISVTRAKVRTLVNEKRPGADVLARLKEDPNRFLITILIGNNIVNVAAASIATAVTISIFGNIGVGIATGAVVILLLVFGEISPKMYATKNAEKYALAVARPIYLLSIVFSPLVWVIGRVKRKDSGEEGSAEPSVTEEEIKEWIEVGKEEGAIEQEEREMLYSVLEFGDTTAREIMTPAWTWLSSMTRAPSRKHSTSSTRPGFPVFPSTTRTWTTSSGSSTSRTSFRACSQERRTSASGT